MPCRVYHYGGDACHRTLSEVPRTHVKDSDDILSHALFSNLRMYYPGSGIHGMAASKQGSEG